MERRRFRRVFELEAVRLIHNRQGRKPMTLPLCAQSHNCATVIFQDPTHQFANRLSHPACVKLSANQGHALPDMYYCPPMNGAQRNSGYALCETLAAGFFGGGLAPDDVAAIHHAMDRALNQVGLQSIC
jgi:hypothetical protein